MTDREEKIKLRVRDPYPCWVDIYINGEAVGSIHHRDLVDLLHETKKAMREADGELKKSNPNEVYYD